MTIIHVINILLIVVSLGLIGIASIYLWQARQRNKTRDQYVMRVMNNIWAEDDEINVANLNIHTLSMDLMNDTVDITHYERIDVDKDTYRIVVEYKLNKR